MSVELEQLERTLDKYYAVDGEPARVSRALPGLAYQYDSTVRISRVEQAREHAQTSRVSSDSSNELYATMAIAWPDQHLSEILRARCRCP